MLTTFIATQVILLPVLGALFLGIRQERKKQQRVFKACCEALQLKVVRNGRGNRY